MAAVADSTIAGNEQRLMTKIRCPAPGCKSVTHMAPDGPGRDPNQPVSFSNLPASYHPHKVAGLEVKLRRHWLAEHSELPTWLRPTPGSTSSRGCRHAARRAMEARQKKARGIFLRCTPWDRSLSPCIYQVHRGGRDVSCRTLSPAMALTD